MATRLEIQNATRAFLTESQKCPKCEGTGYLGHYAHVQGGECFKCDGTGVRGFDRGDRFFRFKGAAPGFLTFEACDALGGPTRAVPADSLVPDTEEFLWF